MMVLDRKTVCFPRWGTPDVTKHGDDDFQKELGRWYSSEESKALEALIELKAKLKTTSTDDFFVAAVEGLAKVVRSEIVFIAKRVLVDDQNAAVEMPPIGEPGSCIMASALHYTTSSGDKHTSTQNKFHAYACPCAYMRHDKIFIIPEDLDGFITNNPNQLPISTDAYMAIPIFAEGKCIAHFAAMWTKESSPKGRLSWAFVETLLHALEDMIAQRLVEGVNFLNPQAQRPLAEPTSQRVIPHDAITVAQSLRPYAGSLSHELRTPMQGVVGMLDVMYATVQEAVQSQNDPYLRKVFQNLKDSIEVVQDSSRRAVVAADNVVHAYDMNMSVPESVSPLQDIPNPFAAAMQPGIIVAGQEIPLAPPTLKRRRGVNADGASSKKAARTQAWTAATTTSTTTTEPSQEIKAGLQEAENVSSADRDLRQAARRPARLRATPEPHEIYEGHSLQPLGTVRRAANVRAVLQYVINEGLKTGGRPEFVTSTPADNGETIEVRSRGSDGTISQKQIRWNVDEALPTTLNYDEKDFSKLVSCVVLNAIKFTEGADGHVNVQARLDRNENCVSIKISDNGPGIPVDFLPKLFKPFSQENGSITRQSDGLGLGLMVAKGISRKLGGDLMCIRTETDTPSHGCEFEIKLPMSPSDVRSWSSSSPCTSPLTHKQSDSPHYFYPNSEKQGGSPQSNELDGLRNDGDIAHANIVPSLDRINHVTNERPPLSLPPQPRALRRLRQSNDLSPSPPTVDIDRDLAIKYPLTFLVVEDNKINRKLLVTMLSKFGYRDILEAYDGAEAVRQMTTQSSNGGHVDVVLMDLWMPTMDGYEATERILRMNWTDDKSAPTVLAVTADVTEGALQRAAQVGMRGFMTKPYKLQDLQRLITEYCVGRAVDGDHAVDGVPPVALTKTAITA